MDFSHDTCPKLGAPCLSFDVFLCSGLSCQALSCSNLWHAVHLPLGLSMTCGVAWYHVISCHAMHCQVLLSSYLVKFHNDPSDPPSLRNGTKPSVMGQRNIRSKELHRYDVIAVLCNVNSATAWTTTSVPDIDLSDMRKINATPIPPQQLSDLNTSQLVVNGRKWCQQANALYESRQHVKTPAFKASAIAWAPTSPTLFI